MLVPGAIKIIRDRKENQQKLWKETLFDIFSIRSWVLFINVLTNVFLSISISFDLIGLFIIRTSNAINYLSAGLICITYNLIIILWQHIYQKSKDLSLKYYSIWTYLKILAAIIFYVFIGGSGVLLYAMYILVFDGKRSIVLYFLGVWVLCAGICTLIFDIFLVIQSLKIFIVSHRFETSLRTKILKIFKENVINFVSFLTLLVHAVGNFYCIIVYSFITPIFNVCISITYWKGCFFSSNLYISINLLFLLVGNC